MQDAMPDSTDSMLLTSCASVCPNSSVPASAAARFPPEEPQATAAVARTSEMAATASAVAFRYCEGTLAATVTYSRSRFGGGARSDSAYELVCHNVMFVHPRPVKDDAVLRRIS